MIRLYQHQEYCARFGLKNAINKGAANAIEAAQKIAETKYRELIGRDIFTSEISDIHHLIEELHPWVVAQKKPADAALTH